MNIFLVEDDENFGTVLKSYLEVNGFTVVWISDGSLAISRFKKDFFDICILDVMLPNVDGFTIAKEIRILNSKIPFIFLTAKSLKEDIHKGFKLGADDYITKPFDSEVLLYKLNAILNRNKSSKVIEDQSFFIIGKYRFDYKMRTIILGKDQHKLSPKEAELLKMLCLQVNNILPRELALKTIWGDDNYFTTRSMDVYLTKLRKFLKEDTSVEIINIHGNGYMLSVK